MRIETELTLGIVDATTVASTLNGQAATVCTFAKDLRERLWKEHLNLVGPLPDDPIEALTNFPQGIVRPWKVGDPYTWPTDQKGAKLWTRHRARCYVNIPGSENMPRSASSTPRPRRTPLALHERKGVRWPRSICAPRSRLRTVC